jgi:hypothetical protein
MGDIDSKAVAIACAKRLSKGKDNTEAAIICSEWDDEIRNPSWYPFRVVMVDGKETVWPSIAHNCVAVSLALVV